MIFPGIKIPAKVYAYAGIMLVLGLGIWKVYDLGRDHEREKYQKELAATQKTITELKGKQEKITVKTEVRYVETVKYIKVKGDTVVKEIPKYIPVETPDLPGGFRVLHDSAALGTFPGAAEDGLPVPVRIATETIVRNYGVCLQWKAALDGQVLWAQEQRVLYLAKCKRLGQSCN